MAVGLGHWSSCFLPLSDMGWPTPEFCCFPTGAAPPLANPRLPLAVFPRVGHLPLFLPSVWLPRSLVALPPKLPSGATATIVNDACMTPWDVVKQRMQVSHSPYRNIFHCAKSTYRHEGLSAFYRSYWTTLVMNVPYTALQFMLYESSKKLLVGEGTADEEEEGLKVQFVAGGIAGGTAAAATTPLDVVKTRLQLEGLGSATRYQTMSVIPVMRRIAAEEGAAALWSGWRPRVLFNAPAAAICWGVYETCKTFLAGDDVADQV
ncbi:MFL1 [Auxenochlorella protothecoides x Auxenochlorella symbiontica]